MPSSHQAPENEIVRAYNSWRSMIDRCENPKAKQYEDWGGRGIHVCERWKQSFEFFLSDLGPRPHGTTLDRVNVHGHYEPGNCRWATRIEQARNRRDSVYIEWRGQILTLAGWSEYLGIPHMTILQRYHRGWSAERLLERPVKPAEREITFNGRTQNLSQWATELRITPDALFIRIDRMGWPLEKALDPSAGRKGPKRSRKYNLEPISINGTSKLLKEWCKDYKINYTTVAERLRQGDTPEEALSRPVRQHVRQQ